MRAAEAEEVRRGVEVEEGRACEAAEEMEVEGAPPPPRVERRCRVVVAPPDAV